MITEYDEDGLRKIFADILEEFGFKPRHHVMDGVEDWDVTEDDHLSSNIAPTHVVGDDPISVQIVTDKPTVTVARGSLTWGGFTMFANASPQLLVGRDARRRSVIIKNLSMNEIALDTSSNVKLVSAASPGFGSAILPAGDTVVLDTRGDVWMVAASNSTGEPVSVWQIFDDGQ